MCTTPTDRGRDTRADAPPPSQPGRSDSHANPRPGTAGGRPDGTLALLPHPIRLHDIENAEAFVQRTIDACGITYTPGEREELLAEGLTILCDLSRRYRPLPPHGRFSGYAAMFLPRKLGDAWHRWHPEHRYVTDPETGRRRWEYDPAAISLDGLYETDTTGGELSGDHQLANARQLRDFVPTHANGRQRPVPAQAA